MTEQDLFQVVWRSYNSPGGRRTACYHLDRECPVILQGGGQSRVGKGRLGAMLAAGRKLCDYEAGQTRLKPLSGVHVIKKVAAWEG